jgi:argininosuccinate synthase
MEKINKIVLAYSGGLDTTVILRWLIENYKCDVYAYIADLGQKEDLEAIRKKALKTGAKDAFVEDLREKFVSDFIFPMLRANAIYEGYLLGTSIARPLIAEGQIRYARSIGADAVAHGATGKGNDQVRFELSYYFLEPKIKAIAPWRIWDFKGRADLVKYAKERGLEVPVTVEKPYSIDRNAYHTSYEGGILEDPWMEPPEDMWTLTVSPEKAPDTPEVIEIEFENGNPVAINGERLSPFRLLEKLNEIGGRNGVGRNDVVENRYVGMKSRGVYETPGGTILHIAHRAIESITMDREVMRIRDSLIPKYSELIYYGYWFSPERELLQAMIDKSQENVTGVVRLKIYKGNVIVTGRKSEFSLYKKSVVSFEEEGGFNMKDSTGFININALRLKLFSMRRKGDDKKTF